MLGINEARWQWLEQWAPVALIVGGMGSLSVLTISVLEIVLYGQRFEVVPEWGLAIIVIPTLSATLIGLLGFYPYVSGSSRWLARGGLAGAAVSLASLLITVIGGLILDLLGIVGFTEEGNPVILVFFLLMFLGLLLSFLCYGLASVLTRRPSRLIGGLLLVPLVEPLSVFLVDIFGVTIPGGPLTSLGVEGVALVVVGYLLWTSSKSPDRGEPTADSIAG